MTPSSGTLVTLATYNEIENLPDLVKAIHAALPEADILVVDDNSPDGTGKWCDERGASDAKLSCLHRAGKQGLGTATIAALTHGVAHGYEWVVNMDADFSHDPRSLPALTARAMTGDVDVVIGSRYVPGGRIEGWPWRRHLMSRAVNTYARWTLRLKAADCSGAFRCYRATALERIDFGAIRSRGYSFQEEVLWHLRRAGCEFAEVPITFVDRQRGVSKIHWRDALEAVWVMLALGWRDLTRRGA